MGIKRLLLFLSVSFLTRPGWSLAPAVRICYALSRAPYVRQTTSIHMAIDSNKEIGTEIKMNQEISGRSRMSAEIVSGGASQEKALTGTVNERLMQELEAEKDKEKFGARSKLGKKLGLAAFRSQKTDAEREAAIAEARNLNGVNPLVTLAGSLVALGIAAGLWAATNSLGAFFTLNPVVSEFYFVERSAAVFRNVAMGLISLASGFFGVSGLGIFLLGMRVAYGVVTGELDPTPLKKPKSEGLEMPNVWALMTTTKPNRRVKKKDDNS